MRMKLTVFIVMWLIIVTKIREEFVTMESHFILNIMLAGTISNFYHHLDLLLHLSPFIRFQSLTVSVSSVLDLLLSLLLLLRPPCPGWLCLL